MAESDVLENPGTAAVRFRPLPDGSPRGYAAVGQTRVMMVGGVRLWEDW